MQVSAIDTETQLLRPAQMAPGLVCTTVQRKASKPTIYGSNESEPVDAVFNGVRADIRNTNRAVGHNIAFDLAVLCEAFPKLRKLIFRALDEDRVTDTMLRQQLLDIAAGRYRGYLNKAGKWVALEYSLEGVARRMTGLHIKKTGFRLFYSLFQGVPIEEWDQHATAVQTRAAAYRNGANDSAFDELRTIIGEKRWTAELDGLIDARPEEARTYALEDATATLAVYDAQEAHAQYLADQYRQTRAAFALHLASCWGMITDGPAVEALAVEFQRQYEAREAEMIAAGLVRKDGTRDTKRAKRLMIEVCKREGLPLRRTAAHEGDAAKCKDADGKPLEPGSDDCAEHICLDGDACTTTDDPILVAYADLTTLKKVLSNDIEMLRKGVHEPVHPSYGIAESGRTTCRNPNIQNQSNRDGIRECFIPRPGKVFIGCDYPQLELYTLAQCCMSWVGYSKLAETLNAGHDPHTAFAARIARCSYDEALARIAADEPNISRFRKFGKVFNFGKPGGLGIPKLIVYAKKVFKLDLDEGYARELNAEWLGTFPEMRDYFKRISDLCEATGKANVESLFTQRKRGNVRYSAACNNGFQALGADCAKNACWYIARALYTEDDSPLFNSRMCAFVHDEFILETADGPTAHDAAHEVARLMVEGANVYLQDVPMVQSRLKPLLMRRWSKKAKPIYEQGRLVPWE